MMATIRDAADAVHELARGLGIGADNADRLATALPKVGEAATKVATVAQSAAQGGGYYGAGGQMTPEEALARTPQGAGIARKQSDTRGTGGVNGGALTGLAEYLARGGQIDPNAIPPDFLHSLFGTGITNGTGGGAGASGGAGGGMLRAFTPRPGSAPAPPGAPLPGTGGGGIGTVPTTSPDVVRALDDLRKDLRTAFSMGTLARADR